jgi:hypothetical protein
MPARKFYEDLHRDLDNIDREVVGWRGDLLRAVKNYHEEEEHTPTIVLRIGELIGGLNSASAILKRTREEVGLLLEFEKTHDEKLFKDV